ncbi:MAG: YfcE family phosphodiesterase [Patescibacteria group bacterium]
MSIAIMSDSHDNLPNINEALKIINQAQIQTIIHCGDVCSAEVTRYISKHFTGQIHLIAGNVAGDHAKKIKRYRLKNVTFYNQTGTIKIANKTIGFAHQPAEAKQLAATGGYDLVFYGHTHRPWEETIGQTRLVNPGTLAGLFARPTFAIYNPTTNQLELKILYTNNC